MTEHETFEEARDRYKELAGDRYQRPSSKLSVYASGAWILNCKKGTIAIVSTERPILFGDHLRNYFNEIARSWVEK